MGINRCIYYCELYDIGLVYAPSYGSLVRSLRPQAISSCSKVTCLSDFDICSLYLSARIIHVYVRPFCKSLETDKKTIRFNQGQRCINCTYSTIFL